MKKKLQLYVVATEERSPLVYNNNAQGWFIGGGLDGQDVLANKRMGSCTNHYLYLSSDEEIKEGDWYIRTGIGTNTRILQNIHLDVLQPYPDQRVIARKIVATTNPELQYKHTESNLKGETLLQRGIYKIPGTLIQYFVQKQGGVKEAMVEYYPEEWTDINEFLPKLKLNPDGTIIWSPVEEKRYTREEVVKIIRKAIIDPNCLYYPDAWFETNYPE